MNDMSAVIIPKSDQLNTDDLLAGPRTITITEVHIRPGTEQPVDIHFEGDGGKPWRPCKSMSRVMVFAWGPDANAYTGHSLTLYADPSVKWGGLEVGGIRISHMSHIDRDMVMALTATKGKKAPYKVRPLQVEQPKQPTIADHLNSLEERLAKAMSAQEADDIKAEFMVEQALTKLKNGALKRLQAIIAASDARFAAPEDDGEQPPSSDEMQF